MYLKAMLEILKRSIYDWFTLFNLFGLSFSRDVHFNLYSDFEPIKALQKQP